MCYLLVIFLKLSILSIKKSKRHASIKCNKELARKIIKLTKSGALFLSILLTFQCIGQTRVVQGVELKGLKKLKPSVVYKLLIVQVGAVLDSTKIQEDVNRLKRLPAITNAKYEVVSLNDSQSKVVYHIQESFTLIPIISAYLTNNQELAYKLGASEVNFLGRNFTLGAYYQKDIYHSYLAKFIAPNILLKHYGFSLIHQNMTTLEPIYIENRDRSIYQYQNISTELLVLCALDSRNQIDVGASFIKEHYQYIEGATSPGIPQEVGINKILYKMEYTYNNLEYFYHNVSGFQSKHNLQYISSNNDGFSGNSVYFRSDLLYFNQLNSKINWANRLRLGLATNNNSPFAPFTLDNNMNIRGVGNKTDRGTGVFTLNTELRYTLFEKNWFAFQANTFLDVGSWRLPAGTFMDFVNPNTIRVFPGVGLRFINKNVYRANFRIDYGFGITKEHKTHGVVFGIGQYF